MAQDFGTPITPTPVPDFQTPPPTPPQKSNRTLIIVIVVIVVLLCCCCLAAVGFYMYQNGDQIMNSINGMIRNPIWIPV